MTKTTEENLSQSKYAEHRNVTKGYIGRMVKEGRLHLIKGKLNVVMSDAELDNKSNNDKAPVSAPTLDGIKYNKQNRKIAADQQSFLFMGTFFR